MSTRAFWIVCLLAAAARPGPPLRSQRVDRAVAALQPAVVKVYGVKGFRGVFGYMTGLIVHESGLLITRNSVTLEEAPQIQCHLHDGRRRAAEIVRYDRRSKMTLLRLLGDPGEKFPAASLGDSAAVRPGQFVLLIGNAYKVAQGPERCAVNMGVVSTVTSPRMRASTTADFHYEGDVILHDAMNNPGVYGGPLADLDGRVIGISGTIVESRETNVQLHYAIPINDLKPFLEDTLKRPDAPRIYDPDGQAEPAEEPAPGYHGIRILKGGINRATAAYVDRVVPGSPAMRAGIRSDDLILKIDHMRVRSWKTFRRMMARYRAGEVVRLTISRRDDVKVIRLKLEVKP
ncbi:MAG: S1C family serine protease [Planctomycetota bacterium]|jgi:S1-C subfamily serine protease